MQQPVSFRNILIIVIAVVGLHLFLFNELFTLLYAIRSDVVEEIQSLPQRSSPHLNENEAAAPHHRHQSHETIPPKIQAMPPNSIEDAEKWRNLMSMKGVPPSVKHLFSYSETESARLSGMEADNPAVIEFIRKNKLLPPPPAALLNKDPARDTSVGQGVMAANIVKDQTNGFFIECGAFDGMTQSVTFLLERKLNWSGLMIEADPNSFALAVEKHRNATLIPACLSATSKPQLVAFSVGKQMSSKINDQKSTEGTVNVQCLPIYSILLAVNRTTIDLFSLDVEGIELDVLKTIPFDKVDIKLLIVEHYNVRQGKKALEDFMTSKGYMTIASNPGEGWATWDCIFVKKGSGYKEARDSTMG